MLTLTIVLGALLGISLPVTIWLLIERAKLKQRHAHAEASLDQSIAETKELQATLDTLQANLKSTDVTLARLEGEKNQLDLRIKDILANHESELNKVQTHFEELRKAEREQFEEFKSKIYESFSASAGKATREALDLFLKTANESFDKSREKTTSEIKQHVAPIAETLKKTDVKLGELERQRLTAYAELEKHIKLIAQDHHELKEETGNLVAALRKPQVRGRYGEIQLQRVAELAGMTEYCDFDTQSSSRDTDGKLLRPDMVVNLPNGRAIAIDAKTNIEAYLDAIEADSPEDQEHHLDRFARHVADQASALSKKDYWTRIDGSFDFVVMFIPGDQFIDAALERRPQLLDLAADQKIILASPSTLIGLLRAVYVGWREKTLSDSAEELFELGKELHDRAAVALTHASKLGESIEQAQKRYNEFVGSIDNRLMPTLRKFEEKGAKSSKELEEPKPIEITSREIRSLPVGQPSSPLETSEPNVAV